MKKIVLTLSLFISSVIFSFGQKEANIWYFGANAGLDFSSGSPVPLTNGALFTYEGCATISDKATGQLLFYTDGDSVWNRNNVVMQNGTGLLGNQSSTQSAVVIPMPGSSTQYYIFTVDAQAGLEPPSTTGFGGVAYSIVDMTMDGGLGALSVKNLSLHSKTCEKIAAVRHCNGRDIWVVVHDWGTNNFYSYLVTPTGISAPVITSVGIVHQDVGSGKNKEAVGYMKFSPDAKKLALVCYFDLNTLQIFDFDNNTGIMSNPNTDTAFPPNLSGADGLYGITFSPDNSRLYCSWFGYNTSPSYVYQYNMLAGSSSAIISSKTQIVTESNTGIAALQIGPDGKMYVAKSNQADVHGFSDYLDVINNPNALGTACNYSVNGLYLGGAGVNQSIFGLPDEVESFLIPQFSASTTYSSCSGGSTVTFTDTTLNGTISVLWNFGDPNSGTSDTSSFQNSSHTFSSSGSFTITAYFTNACKTDTFFQTIVAGGNPNVTAFPVDTTVCSGSSLQLQASGGTTYKWSPSTGLSDSTSSNPNANIFNSITYTVTATAGGCSSTKTVTINSIASPPTPTIRQSHDTLFCSYDSSYTSYQWYFNTTIISGATNSYYVAVNNGNYNVDVTNSNHCDIAAGITVILGIKNYLSGNSISLSPNPAENELTVSGNLPGEKIIISVYDGLGQNVYSSVESPGNKFRKQIDISKFAKGIYLVKIQQAEGMWSGKFVKN